MFACDANENALDHLQKARSGDRLDVPCMGVREGLNGCCARCDDTGTIQVTLTEDPHEQWVHEYGHHGWLIIGTTEAR